MKLQKSSRASVHRLLDWGIHASCYIVIGLSTGFVAKDWVQIVMKTRHRDLSQWGLKNAAKYGNVKIVNDGRLCHQFIRSGKLVGGPKYDGSCRMMFCIQAKYSSLSWRWMPPPQYSEDHKGVITSPWLILSLIIVRKGYCLLERKRLKKKLNTLH